jgi:prophage tail gpP-like protein
MILKIDGKQYDFFNEVNVSLKYDSIASTFSFLFWFDPENIEHKRLVEPLKYKPVTIEHNGELLITGVLLSNSFNSSSKPSLVAIGGYSKAGVLEDCEIPTSNYPLQTQNLKLRDIATRLLKPFNIPFKVDSIVSSSMDRVIAETTASEKQSVKGYLNELAGQRHIVMSHNEKGEVVFTKANTVQKALIDFNLSNGLIPATQMTLEVNGQAMHSQITVIKEASTDGGNAGQSTVNNPFVSVFRPSVKVQTSGDTNTTAQAARMELSKELSNIKLTIELDRWTIDGKVIRPNNVVSVTNPELFIYRKTNFFIESVTFKGNEKAQTCTIVCVLTSVYDNSTPSNIFAQ